MDNNLLQKLKAWRTNTANLQGIEPFRVFANKVLENIAELKPSNKEELMAIKGIKDKKFTKYGKEILSLINDNIQEPKTSVSVSETPSDKPLSVGEYFNSLNRELGKCRARIRGEVGEVKKRDRVVYFPLKDSEDESIINCFMWRSNYELLGVELEEGVEIIAEGVPEIFRRDGRLSFKVSTVELVGEGALKKTYDKLKKKLNTEGLFAEERKRRIPDLSQKIGLITSKTGAVIHDFETNLGQFGFNIKFMDSRVEGQAAVRDLVSAMDYFYDKDIDVLVIIRGGGSLESLQAFNNEVLVRKIAGFNKPVICGIGHEKDVPLASLAADKMVSTPTAVTHVLNDSWQKAVSRVELNKEKMFRFFGDTITDQRATLSNSFSITEDSFGLIFKKFSQAEELLKRLLVSLKSRILETKKEIANFPAVLISNLTRAITQTKQNISSLDKLVLTYSPERQLKLGYSIVRDGGTVIKKIDQLKINQRVDVTIGDGSFESEVNKIYKNKDNER